MSSDNHDDRRVTFQRGINVTIMAIDGTWRRDCVMEDISANDARLAINSSVEGLNLKEFFLLLSSTGLAYRRCELLRVNGNEIEVQFLKQQKESKKSARKDARAAAR